MGATTETPSIRSFDERAALSAYGRGTNLADIHVAGRSHDWVSGVVMRICGMDRGRARAAVLSYDARLSTTNGRATAEKDAPAAAPKVTVRSALNKPAPPKVVAFVEPAAAEAPEIEVVVERKPTPVAGRIADTSVDDLLARAETSGIPRVEAKAVAIRKMLADLDQLVEQSEQERVLRATIRVLTEQRDKAVAELKELTGKPTTVAAVQPDREEYAAIRAWAADNGHDVKPAGRIPRAVVDAYRNRAA